jgi:hypothetical protein
MEEAVQTARLDSLQPVIAHLPVTETTRMLLEQVPTTWLDAEERRQGIRLERFDPATDFDAWTRGRIFDAGFELRWERSDGAFQAVYCGLPEMTLPDFQAVDLGAGVQPSEADPGYYLWGRKVQEEDLHQIGAAAGSLVFVELQVPRLLHYPVAPTAQRVQLRVQEYRDPSGALVYYRWRGLEEVT